MTSDAGNNEKHRTTLILGVAAKMFRQHSDLFEQQAAVLERIASDPQSPSSWAIDEPSPESRQRQIIQENTTALAVKSYESMLQIQKRVDYLERLLTRNGIKRITRKPTSEIPCKRRTTTNSKTAFYWFRHDHGPAIAEEFGVPNISDNLVRQKLLKLWAAMNPNQRLPYWEKAQEEIERDSAMKLTAKKSSKKAANRGKGKTTKVTTPAVIPDAEATDRITGAVHDAETNVGADGMDSRAVSSKESVSKHPDESSDDSPSDDESLNESDDESDEDKDDLLFVEV